MALENFNNLEAYFIGIGGIGMSGVAQILANEGATVSGSDVNENANVMRLRNHGIQVYNGHDRARILNQGVVIISSDIQPDNVELKAAIEKNILILHRAEMLAELMSRKRPIAISGTHGKTTTTALIGHLLEHAELDPTIVNGGILNNFGSNAKQGKGQWFVAEADESDASFLKLPKEIAVITNIDPEHMNYYKTFENLYNAFENFILQLPQTGCGVLCIDHPIVYQLWKQLKGQRHLISYGAHQEAEIQCISQEGTVSGSEFAVRIRGEQTLSKIKLPLFGQHNVQNALAAIAVATKLGLDSHIISSAFQSFQGVQRRFTFVGEVDGISIIDDYAHHPIEIQATLKAARQVAKGRVIAVLQPHRYTRLASHFEDFTRACVDADKVILLPVYSAGELPIEGVDHKALHAAMGKEAYVCNENDDLSSIIRTIAAKGDMVVCLGAGDISSRARALPEQMKRLKVRQVG